MPFLTKSLLSSIISSFLTSSLCLRFYPHLHHSGLRFLQFLRPPLLQRAVDQLVCPPGFLQKENELRTITRVGKKKSHDFTVLTIAFRFLSALENRTIFVWPWKMVSVSFRYLLYQPMDEKIKTWTLRFPAKENIESIVRLANRVAVWRQSEVSIDF